MDFKNFKATSRKKKICGFTCTEYVCDDEKVSSSIWISELTNGLGLFSNGFGKSGAMDFPAGMIGVPMETLRKDKKTNETVQMSVTGIDLNETKDISTVGFTVQ